MRPLSPAYWTHLLGRPDLKASAPHKAVTLVNGMQATLQRPDTDLTRPIVLALWGTAFFCVFLQLFMGADVMVVMVDFVCVTLGLYALRIYSIFNAGRAAGAVLLSR